MKSMKFHFIAIFSSLLLGAGLAVIQPGNFWIGWLVFSILLLSSAYLFRAAYFWTNAGTSLAILLALAFLVRLALGVGLYLGLPDGGNPNEQHDAGYIFLDSYRRDAQAWELAAV